MAKASLWAALLCAALLSVVGQAWGQGSGSISGRVTDASGAVLQGAQVELEPKAAPTVTNQQGEFTILNLGTGNYKVTVSYVGFTAASKDVAVTAGQAARFDAVLGAASQTEQVEVYAERGHGEAEAINRQFTSPNILQVLPVEVITSLPNTNIADALGRLPSVTLERDEGEGKYVQIRGLEPRLSNVTVNGVDVPSSEAGVRQIKLDSIPANLVESVEINKTLSANQDGDAIGGSVNLVTKTAGEKPTLYINGMGGYTPIDGGRKLTEMDSTIGQRFGAQKKLGVLFGASYDWNGRGINDIEPGVGTQAINGTDQPIITGIDLRDYAYYRERLGFAGSADYKLADGGGLYVRGLYSHFNNFGDRWVYSPSPGTYNSPTDAGTGTVSYNASIRRPIEVIGSLAAGGKHVLSKSWLAYDLSISRSTEADKGYSQADFAPTDSSPLAAIPYTLDWTNPHTPKLSPPSSINLFDTTQYYMTDINVSHNFAAQLNLQAAIAAAHTYSLGGHFAILELGFKIRNAHKFEDAAQDNYNTTFDPTSSTPDPALQLSGFQGGFRDPNYYDKIYPFGPTADYGKIRSFFNANRNNANLFQIDQQGTLLNTISNSYDLAERITAGYLMNTLEFGRVRLQTGLRFEATSEDVKGNQVLLDSSGNLCSPTDPDPICAGSTGAFTPIHKTSSYLDPLPSVQFRYALSHDAAIRAVYGRGIARPNFGDIPPFFNADASANAVATGNPNLKATHANNYDLLYEQTLRPLGLIQAGFFYKQLSDPIYQIRQLITDPAQFGANYVGFELDRPINGSSAHLFGLEIAYQQHLTFLPGLAKGLGLSANYSYTNSYGGHIPNRSDTPALQRQAPNTWNVSPTYDRGRLSMRVGISHNDANIFQYNYFDLNPDGTPNPVPLGKKGPLGDIYLYAHTQVDAQGSFRMYRGLELIVSGLNLTNEVFGFYQGSPQYPIQREFYKASYSFGLRFNLSNEPR